VQSSKSNSEPEARRGFWRRQFAAQPTIPQVTFDVVAGIILPILCFLFDPIVFAPEPDRLLGPLGISQYQVLVYAVSAISIATLALWLAAGSRIESFTGVVAGVLFTGAICSVLIGVLILPLTLLGLLVIIGVLGFIPFFTFFVYLRNAIRALNSASERSRTSQARLVEALLLGAAITIVVSVALHWKVNRVASQSIAELLTDDSGFSGPAVRRLRYVGWAANLDQLVLAYSNENNQTRKNNLARAYREITGHNIEDRLAILLD
jgi:hypothetical protein